MIALTFRSFGMEPPRDLSATGRAMLWLAAFCFVAVSVVILATLNLFCVVVCGVTVSFLGRNGVKFRFLHLFGRVPLIAVTLPALFGYAAWREMRDHGVVETIGPVLLTAVLAAALLAGIVALNAARGRSPGR